MQYSQFPIMKPQILWVSMCKCFISSIQWTTFTEAGTHKICLEKWRIVSNNGVEVDATDRYHLHDTY